MGVRLSKISSRIVGPGGVGRRGKVSRRVPKGYVPVYVGVDNKMKRFMVHTTSFGDADFLELLCKSAEEYGLGNQGVLRIPYDAKVFEEWMGRKANWKMTKVGS